MKDPIISGIDAPLIPVYCGICDLVVERLQFEANQGPHGWSFNAQCCGKTVAGRVSQSEVLRMSATGEKYYAIVGKGHARTIKKLARLDAPKVPRLFSQVPRSLRWRAG